MIIKVDGYSDFTCEDMRGPWLDDDGDAVRGRIGAALTMLAEAVLLEMEPPLPAHQAKAAERAAVSLRSDTEPWCPDCGEYGERAGHMGCQYPQDHE